MEAYYKANHHEVWRILSQPPEARDEARMGEIGKGLLESVAKAMFESNQGEFLKQSLDGVIDKTKQVALYVDQWGLDHSATAFLFGKHDAEREPSSRHGWLWR